MGILEPLTLTPDACAAGSVLQRIDHAIAISDREGRIAWVNPGFERASGRSADALIGRATGALLRDAGCDAQAIAYVADCVRRGEAFKFHLPAAPEDGRTAPIAFDVRPVRDDGGMITEFVAIETDVADSGESLKLALESARQGMWQWDVDSGHVQLSEGFLPLFGWSGADQRGIDGRLLDLVHAEDAPALTEWYRALESDGSGHDEVEYRIRGGDGDWHWIISRGRAVRFADDGRALRICGIHADITRRKQTEHDIRRLAYFDALTGLANRTMLQEKLAQLVAGAERARERLAVLFIDLDNFKTVNDSLGHEAGDMLLRGVAERLRTSVRGEDVIARLGGDEFVVVLTQLPADDLPARAARRLIESLTPPFVLHGQEIHVSPSIGISVFPEDGRDGPTLVKNADIAMYRVKEAGRNSYRFFTAAMNATVVREARIESRLRRAARLEQLKLAYQPLVDAKTRKIVGAEALIRWIDEELGPVPATKFIPIAERTSLIGVVGEWALRAACKQAREWIEAGHEPLQISVNVSPIQFNDAEFVPRLRAILAETGLAPHLLMLELTEGTLMKDAEQSVATLCNLKSMGVRLAVDDFGTGYSSLAYLRRFPIDKLKIDRSFIREIPASREAVEIASAVVDIGKRLHLQINAEGVETEAQASFLQRIGCAELQGFHFATPLPPDEFAELLTAGGTVPADKPASG